jgi:hypothetical protein
MSLVKKVVFLVMLLVAILAVQKVRAASDFCPYGCDCDGSGAPFDPYVVDCWMVEDCSYTYPNFCDDFYDFCYRDLCSTVAQYSCWGGYGSCYGECGCAGGW